MTLQPVDGIEFLVLVDNCLDSLSSVPKYVSLEWPRLMRNGMTELSGEAQCCANHGLSLVIAAHVGPTSHALMFDAGPEDYVLERNAPRLGVDFSRIEGIVLSHGHWDHAGGLPAAVRSIVAAAPHRPVPIYVHPGMFRQRAMTLSSGAILPIKAIPLPEELTALGAEVLSSDKPQSLLDDFFWISGEIPRVTAYEKGFPGHLRRSADGRTWDADPLIMDERFVAVHVRDKGLVVFTACSHAGVVNVLFHARESFPSIPYMPSREASTYLRQMKRSFQKQWTTLPLSISASLPRVIARVGARHKLSLTSSVRVSSRHPPLARRTQYELARWQAGHGYHAFNRTRRYGPSTWRSSVAAG